MAERGCATSPQPKADSEMFSPPESAPDSGDSWGSAGGVEEAEDQQLAGSGILGSAGSSDGWAKPGLESSREASGEVGRQGGGDAAALEEACRERVWPCPPAAVHAVYIL